MKRIIIIGATSGIAYEVAKRYIHMGWQVGIAGRRQKELIKLQAQSPEQISIQEMDVNHPDAPALLEELILKTGGMDIYFHSSGIGKQNRELEPDIELDTVRTNVEGWTRMITAAYDYFRKNGGGQLAVISSIAGTKGLGSAPAYSATKSFQSTYIEALSQLVRMENIPISFTDIRPGFVATPLLSGDDYPLMLDAGKVADKIIHALNHKKQVAIIDWRYRILVFFWKWIPRAIWIRLPVKM